MFPGSIRTDSSPVTRKIGQSRSSASGAATSAPSDTDGASFFEANPTAKCPMNIAAAYAPSACRMPGVEGLIPIALFGMIGFIVWVRAYYKALVKCRTLFDFERERLNYASDSVSKSAARG